MKCDYCGKELPLGTTVCDGCGAKYENNKVELENNNNTPYQEVNNIQPNYNMQQPYYGAPKKSGTGLKVTIIILVVVIVALLGVGAWLLFFNGDDKEESSNSDKDRVEDKVDNKKDDDDDDDNYYDDDDYYDDDNDDKDDEKPNYGNSGTVTFEGYTLSVLKGFDSGVNSGIPYIENDECLIMYIKYPLNYDSVVQSEDLMIQELDKQGMKITSFNTKTINGRKYVLIEGNMSSKNAEFAYMITDLDENTPICLTILSSSLQPFDDDWYEYGAEFIDSAKK